MTRTSLAILFGLSSAALLALACNSGTSTNMNQDFASKGDLATSSSDLAQPDFAGVQTCGSVEAWCGNSQNLCWGSWTNASKASSWCQPGVTADIYITPNPCSANFYGVALVSPNFSPSTGRYYFYRIDASGALVTVASYDPDGDGSSECIAGPTGLADMINAGGCSFANPISCVNGVLAAN